MKKKTTFLSALGWVGLLGLVANTGYARSLLVTPARESSPGPFFVENKGQITDQHGGQRKDIGYRVASTEGLHIFIGGGGIHYQWERAEGSKLSIQRMDVTLVNANKDALSCTSEALPYKETYYSGAANNTAIKAGACRKILYKNVYPAVDWQLYIDGLGRMEYDFIVHPGGKVSDIKLKFGGTRSLAVGRDGKLQAVTAMGTVTENAPYSFQADGQKVASRFVLDGDILSFETAPYSGTLTIDPVLEWATYYGGPVEDQATSVTTDERLNVYITGHTRSAANIATTGAYNTTLTPQVDAFIAKLDSAGHRIWGTYYGGSGTDFARQIACDRNGSLYIAGYTQSAGLGTAGAYQTTPGGSLDGFLARFDTAGNRIWHTYYGGTSDDLAQSVTCDQAGNVYLAGYTNSTSGIASAGAYRTVFSGMQDAFLAKFNSAGARMWGTYFGGLYIEYGNSVACDPAGNVYLCGRTSSYFDIASPGAHQTTYLGTVMFGFNFGYVGFLTKFDGNGNHGWGTYYSAELSEATAVACDPFYNVFIAGRTMKDTAYIATPGSHQDTMGSYGDLYGDGFLARFDSAGVRSWGTYFGGSRDEEYLSVACNLDGDVYLAGRTTSSNNIATTGAYLAQLNDSCTAAGCQADAFLARFDSAGTQLWGTYYGAKPADNFYDVAGDGYGSIYACGFSGSSSGIATAGSHQDALGGGLDGILVKFYDCPAPPAAATITGKDTVCANSLQVYSVPSGSGITNNWELPAGWSGQLEGDTITVHTSVAPGAGVVKVSASAQCELRTLTGSPSTHAVYVPVFNEATITVNGFVLGTTVPFTSYQWLKSGAPIAGATASTYTVTENGDYKVAVTDAYGCSDTSDNYAVTNVTGIDGPTWLAQQIQVYPNPATSKLFIKSPVPVTARLTGLEGRIIMEVRNDNELSLNGMADGVYLLHLFDKNGQLLKAEKIVKH